MTELIIPAEAPDLNELKERRIDILARRAIFALLMLFPAVCCPFAYLCASLLFATLWG